MSIWTKIRGTLETIFQVGKGGPNIKANAGVIEARNAADSAFVIVRGLDPVGANDLVTLNHFDTNNAAAVGLTYKKLAIGTATVVSSTALPDSAQIRDIFLDVTTLYDNNATLAVKRTGDATVAPMGTTDSNLPTVGLYHVPQMLSWGITGAGTVTATIANIPTVGASTLYIGYVTPESIA